MDARTSDTHAATTAKLISGLLLIGAALALLGNGLHPFFPADVTTEEFLAEAGGSALWVPVHLGIGVALVMLTAAIVLLAGHLRATAGAVWANLTATLAVIGGTIFTLQIVGLDGVALPTLADAGASAEVAEVLVAIDNGLLSLSVFLFLGATFMALGQALDRADVFAGWVRWTATIGGGAGLLVGLMMLLDAVPAFTFIAFRVVSLAATAVTIGIGLALRKGPATATASPPATSPA